MADRLLMVNHGRQVLYGRVEQVREQFALNAVYVDGQGDWAALPGVERVLLTGGCFQNRLLLERTVVRLRAEGFAPYWPRRLPPNDGGLAVGQIVAAAGRLARETP